MDLVPLFRKVVLGAAESSLDVAGAALLPGAWPILKGALQPVLERLKDKLGGGDVTASVEQAQRAVAELEADRHLQEVLRSKLLEQLDALVQGQQGVNGDVQKLMLIVAGDQRRLDELLGGVGRIEQRLDQGVNLSDEAVEKLTVAIAQQAETSRRVRGLALREMGPVSELLQDQVNRLQIRAVELVRGGDLDRAVDELRAGLMLIAALLNEAPTDLTLRLQLGFVYKTMSQVFDAAGDAALARTYIDRAEEVFRFVKDEAAGDESNALYVANAIHGLGNVEQGRGEFDQAIEKYKLATDMFDGHFYSWHDMFLCYWELAKQGRPNLGAMRHALAKVEETARGQPGLGAQYIAQLEQILRQLGEARGTSQDSPGEARGTSQDSPGD
jgi:tetratricopeptide (TPR) repeat protein